MSDSIQIIPIKVGYAKETKLESGDIEYRADGSITLIKGALTILVDTGGPWDKQFLLEALNSQGISVCDIDFVIGTHGHSDHIGNLSLFPEATFVVCHDICKGDCYIDNQLAAGEPFVLSPDIEVIPTAGHTCSDVSLVVRNSALGTVVIAGDLFESEGDLDCEELWRANSYKPELQAENRRKVLQIADYIVPGHGPMFKVDQKYKSVE